MPAVDPVNQDVVIRLSVQPQGDLGKHFKDMASQSSSAHRTVQQDMDRTERASGRFAGQMHGHFSRLGFALRGVHMGMMGVTDVALRMSSQFGQVNFAAQDTIKTMSGLAEGIGIVHMLFMGLHGLTGMLGASGAAARTAAEGQRELAAAHTAAAAAANAHAVAEGRAAVAATGGAVAGRAGALGGLAGGIGMGAVGTGVVGAGALLLGAPLLAMAMRPRPFYRQNPMGTVDAEYNSDAYGAFTENVPQYLMSSNAGRGYLKGVSFLADYLNPQQMLNDYLATGSTGGRVKAINRFEESQRAITRQIRATEAKHQRERILAIKQQAERQLASNTVDRGLADQDLLGGMRFDLQGQQAVEASRGGDLVAGRARADLQMSRLSSLANAPGGLAMRHQLEQQYEQFELQKSASTVGAQTNVSRAREEFERRKEAERSARARYSELSRSLGAGGGAGVENAGERLKAATEEVQRRTEQSAESMRKLQQAMVEQGKVAVENAQKERELARSRRQTLQATLDSMQEQKNRLAEHVGSMDPGRLAAAVQATRHLDALRRNPNLARDRAPLLIRQGNRMTMLPGTSGGLTDAERQLIRETGGEQMLSEYDRGRGQKNPALAELDRLHGLTGGQAQRQQIQQEIDRQRQRENEAGKLIQQGQSHLANDLKNVVGPAIEKQTAAILAAMKTAMDSAVELSVRRFESEIQQTKQQLKNGANGIR